jgi:DNA-binding response OmpR family regulator
MIKQLRVPAIGSQVMLRRLLSRVDAEEVSITGCSDAWKATYLLEQEQFDIVIVDHLIKDAQAVCKLHYEIAKVPVALMPGDKWIDWHCLRGLEVDGYLPESAGSSKLTARIKACSRRKVEQRKEFNFS